VRRCFGGLVALDRIAFQVRAGQIKAIIGPNGAGKTTLFNIVSAILRPDRGEIRFDGRSIIGLKPFEVARRGISRTFQTPSLFLHMTVLENVMTGRHCRTRSGLFASALRLPAQRREESLIHESAMENLRYAGIDADAPRPVGAISFGKRRMVELARALATEPRLLLLDEPASGLNTRETDDLAAMIRRIRDRGITVLIVEHDMSLVMDISDEILVLNQGIPLTEGTPAEVRNNEAVVAVYLGGQIQSAHR